MTILKPLPKVFVCQWSRGEKMAFMDYPIYDDTLNTFIEVFYKTSLISYIGE